jgi:anti-sigma B factor antagonist
MESDVLHIGVSEIGDTRVVRLVGDLDSYTSNRLRSISEKWIPGAKKVIVNLDGLEYIDSSGLSALVGVSEVARKNGVLMLLSCHNSRIYRVLELTGLVNFFSVVDIVSDADSRVLHFQKDVDRTQGYP